MRHNYTYQAFGTLESTTGGTDNYYLFAGEQWDESLNEYYLRQRQYNLETGRFISRDTFEEIPSNSLTMHRYIYGNGNPVSYTDPSGYLAINLGDVLLALEILAAGWVVYATPTFGLSLLDKRLTNHEVYNIEARILTESRSYNSGGANTFAYLMQHAANQITPNNWINNKSVRAQYLGIASDMFTASEDGDGNPHDFSMFGQLGNSGPRSQGRPQWLRSHTDPQSDWRIFDPNDPGFGREGIPGNATGRRDHFLANAHLGLPAGLLISAYQSLSSTAGRAFEDSTNDWRVNQLGWAFGNGVVITGGIPQQQIGSWIRSNLADTTP
jgi:RHS repeat-associated protein